MKELMRVCIQPNISFDYDKTIDIYASKYSRRMLLFDPLAREDYIDFGIFS